MKKLFMAACLSCLTLLPSNVDAQSKWKPLFGNNLEQASYNPSVWSMKDGVLSAVKDESIWTKVQYENFQLDLEFKTDVGTNSGVVVYCTDTKDWIPNSVEIQIADDYYDKWADGPAHGRCAAVYGHLAATRDRIVKRPGEWNRMIITCQGKHITVELNGKLVTDMDMNKWTSGKVNPDGSQIPGWLPKPYATIPTKGYIGLQGKHGDALIWFRNMDIRSLD